jgi:hypothetical protein
MLTANQASAEGALGIDDLLVTPEPMDDAV